MQLATQFSISSFRVRLHLFPCSVNILDIVHYIEEHQVIDPAEKLRRFNREWTQLIGLLEDDFLGTEHTLPEARVLFELGQRNQWERMDLRQQMNIDDSYLTRLLAGLCDDKLIRIGASKQDGRKKTIALTKEGKSKFKELDRRSHSAMGEVVDGLTDGEKRTLNEVLSIVPRLVGRDCAPKKNVVVRELQSGDLGWVIQRHGEIYADEYNWNMDFEGLVAKIVAEWYAGHSEHIENAWIAELDDARAGCIFCCAKDPKTAQLRILLVEPWARGHGIGSTLVSTCIDFARNAGYSSMMLWTNDVLSSARKIYEAAGFVLVEEETHHSFGHQLIGQNWVLDL